MFNKKGSHVEFVLSFIIFILFLVFLYIILQQPLKTERDKQFILENTKAELERKIRGSLTTITIFGEGVDGYDCLKIDNSDLEISGQNMIAKNAKGEIIGLKILEEETQIEINSNEINQEGNVLFKIYNSKEPFITPETDKTNCIDGEITLIKTKDYVFKTKIDKLIEDYSQNYGALRQELGLGTKYDFGFGLRLSDDSIIETSTKIQRESFIKEFQVEYIDENANINQGQLIIKVY